MESSSSSSSSRCIGVWLRSYVVVVVVVMAWCMNPSSMVVRATKGSSWRTDAQALMQFKAEVEKDPNGALEGWEEEGGGDPCRWKGVTCSSEKRVVKLELRGEAMEGELAVYQLAWLDMLEELDLSGNSFHGNLSGLGCGSLQSILLGGNNLVGLDFLSSCSAIQRLDLSRNSLNASLPHQFFSDCGSLQFLDLSHNHLTGSLPPSIARCSSLHHLNLSSNLLSGPLPFDLLSSNCSSCSSSIPSLQILDLSFNNLSGPISDLLFTSCSSITSIDLSSNSFTGEIPPSIERCTALQLLNFSRNKLESRLPVSLGSLKSIKRLDISNNHIVGPIPPELGQICSTLLELDLSTNNISGTIPYSFASCSLLQTLNLASNNLSGSFPSDIVSQLQSLQNLLLAFNNFVGSLPIAVTNCSSLKVLDLGSNSLTGRILPEICPPSFALEKLLLPNNDFWGEVPAALANCSQLKVLDLSFNHLQGSIPVELSSLANLESLSMWFNGLTGEIPKQFGGLSNLKALILNNNFLTGGIPEELSNCTGLQWLCLTSNQLTGNIPAHMGSLKHLTLLQLGNNSLSGQIPAQLANCSNFLWVDLNSNSLSGPIPPGLGRHPDGVGSRLHGDVFAFVRNLGNRCIKGLGSLLEFSGITEDALLATLKRTSCGVDSTRLYVGDSLDDDPDFSSIQFLDLSYNRLEGSIPEDMGYLKALQMLSLAHNQLTGKIPETFSNLRNIGVLDLSYNKLEGGIWPLANCTFLVQIDVSNNNFSGVIPSTGQLSTAPAPGFADNPGLCGEPLPPCGSDPSAENASSDCDAHTCISGSRLAVLPWANSIVLGILISIAFLCMLIVWAIMIRARSKQNDTDLLSNLHSSCNGNSNWNLGGEREPLSINVATFERPLRKLTFAQLIEATNGFSQESLIGIGGFGEVYKAELRDGSVVAIKKLLQFSFQGDREFMAEMETLGKIKHRNLVPLLGYCKVGEERLLVYEYMHGGSLDEMLHGNEGKEKLTWDLRKQIAKGAARGLAFLHHNCIPHIIHRDMKSSNVLLDQNLEARVSDFGMARLISALDTHLSVSTLAGTPGYVPPEYYQSFRCTTKGDVYSFGVILLELLTGKRPTDKEEFEDSNLVGWVREHVNQKRCMEVLDPDLKGVGAEYEMMQYLRIASDCLDDLPSRRPTMLQVVAMFKELQVQDGAD